MTEGNIRPKQRLWRRSNQNQKALLESKLPDVQVGFRKGIGTRDQIANTYWIIEKASEFQKTIYFCSIDYAKAFDCVDHNKLWKILKEMGIPDHVTCLLRNLYVGQEATVRTGHGTTAAAAAAKSLQLHLTLCDPIDGSPPGSPTPGILQARTLEWVAISFSNAWKWKVKVKSLSRVRLLATKWTAAHQAPPSMGFSRQEYCSGLLLTSPGTTDWFQIGKGVCQGCILSPCLFNLYAMYMRNAGLDEAQAGIKIAGRSINNLRYADDTTPMAENQEELKSLLMKVKEESENVKKW